jgi:hypothetical protein
MASNLTNVDNFRVSTAVLSYARILIFLRFGSTFDMVFWMIAVGQPGSTLTQPHSLVLYIRVNGNYVRQFYFIAQSISSLFFFFY